MSTRIIGRVSAAAIVAVGLLVASALPAAASATSVEILPGSTVVISPSSGGTPVATVVTEGHQTDSDCAPINSQPDTHIPVDFGNSTSTTATIGAASTGWGEFVVGTNKFKARLNILGGTITSGNTVTLSATATFATCDSTMTLCTTNTVTATLTLAPGAPNPGHHPTVSTTTRVVGQSNAHITTPFTCNTLLRSTLNSTTAYLDLLLHFTDSTT